MGLYKAELQRDSWSTRTQAVFQLLNVAQWPVLPFGFLFLFFYLINLLFLDSCFNKL